MSRDDGVLVRRDVQRGVFMGDAQDGGQERGEVVDVDGVGVDRLSEHLGLVASLT
jgi:hypothetical protein